MDHRGSELDALSGLGDPVRRRLYEFVAGRTEPVGPYHLDKLATLGLLTASYQRPAGRSGPGAGRPAKVYARSGSEFAVTVPPREYELAARLLAAAVEADRSGESRAALHDAAEQFGGDLGRRCRAAEPGREDLQQAATDALREHGFEPWPDEDGTVRLRNCPFHHLAAQHTEIVCGMNLALIEGLVSGLGVSGLHPALDPQPGYCCVVIGTGTPEATRGGRHSHDA